MFVHLTLFVALAATGKAQAGEPADVVVAGPTLDVAITAAHVWALQEDAVVMLSHDGQIQRRLPLPTPLPLDDRRGQAAAKAARDNALFDKFGVADTFRDTIEGEAWLDDNRTRADKATPPAPTKASIARHWIIRASLDRVYVASDQGLWQLRDEDPVWRHVAALPSAPVAVAASTPGTVVIADAASLRVLQLPAIRTCVPPLRDTWLAPLVAQRPDAACEAGAVPGGAVDGPATALTRLTVHSTCNAGGRVFASAQQGLFVLQGAGDIEWQKVHGPAPFSELRCSDAAPDVLLAFSPQGAGAALSLDAGTNWQTLPGLEGQPALGMVATEAMVWVATSFGLLVASNKTPVALQVAARRAFAPAQPSKWRALLPRVHLAAQWQRGSQSDGRQTTAAAAFLSAEFSVNSPLKQAATVSIRSQVAGLPTGAQAQPPPCLARLRDSAAAMAMADPERMRAMASRARSAGWLPELRLRADKRWGRNQSLDLEDGTSIAPLGLNTVNDLRVEVRATWDLSRAVYSPDELAVALGTLRVVDARQELMTLVNRLFFERRRLAAFAAASKTETGANGESAPAPTSGPDAGEPLEARLGRLTADIDALTGGLAQTCW